MPQLKYLASKAKAFGILDQEDLLQDAAVALMRAREKFDPSLGFKWATYALPRAHYAMIDALREADHVPRLERARLTARGEQGRKVMSIDHQAGEISLNEGGIPPAAAQDPGAAVAKTDLWALVRRRVEPRVAEVLERYYAKEQTLAAIGQALGLSESRVCQLHARGLRALRCTNALEAYA